MIFPVHHVDLPMLLSSLKDNPLYIYLFIFFISFLESFAFLGLAVPGAAFVVTAGVLAYEGYFSVYLVIVFAVLGAILADIASYILGSKYFLFIKNTRLYQKYKDYFIIGELFFEKHGSKSVFLGRFVGVLRPVVPFVAGTMQMKKEIFLLWAIISGILWGVCYIGVGYFFGKGFAIVDRWTEYANYVILLLILLSFVFYLLKKRGRWNL